MIALAATVLLTGAVAFELRGLWRSEENPSDTQPPAAPAASDEPASAAPIHVPVPEQLPAPAPDPDPSPYALRGDSPFIPASSVNRLPHFGPASTPRFERSPPVLPLPNPAPMPAARQAGPADLEELPVPTPDPALRIPLTGPRTESTPATAAPSAAAPSLAAPAAVPIYPNRPLDHAAGPDWAHPTADPQRSFDPPVLPRRLPPTKTVANQSAQSKKTADSPQSHAEALPGITGPSLGNGPSLGLNPPAAEDLPLTPPLTPPSSRKAPEVRQAGAWWAALVPQPQRDDSEPRPLDIATLIHETILHSEHVQAVSLDAQVAETQICQADAAFDPAAFVDSKWIDTSDPVGNVLTTGGPPRLSREEWSSSIGFRRKTRSGGAFEIAQRLIEEDNNSIFFVPADQATSRLTVSLNQPLLRGGGQAFNRSLILLAMHDTQVARDRFRSELETQVLRVVREYWELYYQRSVLLQQQSALRQAEAILDDIKARAAFDSLDSQVQRVRATVAIRDAHIVRARAAVRNAESRLRALSNSPVLGGVHVELLPVEPPLLEKISLPVEDARELALANRTEVDAALTRVRAAGVELGMSKNEMLPTLGLVLESYVSGLEGNFDLAGSLGEQFSEGAPSYTAGLLFEMPLGRRRGKAFYKQKVLELRQAEHIFRDTVATLSSEVEIALREVETTWQELVARGESAEATRAEVAYLRARIEHIPGEDNRAVSFLMEELLNAIDRLVRDESELAAAQRNYAVSIAEFHRATGMLVAVEAPTP
jgi:outer membrane protein